MAATFDLSLAELPELSAAGEDQVPDGSLVLIRRPRRVTGLRRPDRR
ncbi:MAG: hypothetical protein QME94_16455 [Anaerolineae bacterium]|nr:hypothetical protein [Anaerolineae bacterium]